MGKLDKAMKRARLSSPPKHTRSIRVQVRLKWRLGAKETTSDVVLLLDSGATGPVLSTNWAKEAQVPCVRRKVACPITDASGNNLPGSGRWYTRPLKMIIGDHENEMNFEVADMPEGKIDGYLPMSWLERHNPDIDWETGTMTWRSEFCKESCLKGNRRLVFITEEELLAEDNASIHLLGMAQFTGEDGEDIALKILPEYQDYSNIFSQQNIEALPQHSKYDHKIDLQPGTTPPFGPIYPLSEKELKALRDYLEQMQREGKIRRSTSSAAAPILFVPKPDGSLRLCIDYRGLNKITIKNRYPLPLMNEIRDRLGKATVFTKIDLKNGYYLLRMAEGEEWKTAFRCRYGLYEYTVMPFGLCNAPSTFQSMINDVFRDLLDEGVIAYMDDILIYSETIEEHVALVRRVMEKLRKAGLCVSIKKSSFHQRSVEFLGYKISEHGIEMTTEKIESIKSWPTPKVVVDVQSFMGFANFYRRFIEGFSKVAKPLTDLTKKETLWEWTESCQRAFDHLKERFVSAPILAHFNPDRLIKLETDASDFALGAILSQLSEEDGKWHPVAYHSRKFHPAEINYDVHDKEMTAIVAAFKEWDHLLRSAADQIVIYTDHKNLEYFNSTKILNRRQHRWAEFLQPFNFRVIYREGRLNEKADALSRRRDYRLEGGGNSRSDQEHTFFNPGQWVGSEERNILEPPMLRACQKFRLQSGFLDEIQSASKQDDLYGGILKGLRNQDTNVDSNFNIEKN